MEDNIQVAHAVASQTAELETDTRHFEAWQHDVDVHVGRMTGLTITDLPDYDYMSEYERGCKSRTVARRAIRAAGGF